MWSLCDSKKLINSLVFWKNCGNSHKSKLCFCRGTRTMLSLFLVFFYFSLNFSIHWWTFCYGGWLLITTPTLLSRAQMATPAWVAKWPFSYTKMKSGTEMWMVIETPLPKSGIQNLLVKNLDRVVPRPPAPPCLENSRFDWVFLNVGLP